jgi:hypothetical protein
VGIKMVLGKSEIPPEIKRKVMWKFLRKEKLMNEQYNNVIHELKIRIEVYGFIHSTYTFGLRWDVEDFLNEVRLFSFEAIEHLYFNLQ